MDDEQPGLGSRLSLALGLQYNIILLLGAVSHSRWRSPRHGRYREPPAGEVVWLLIAVVFPGVSRWIKKHNRRADDAADEPVGCQPRGPASGLPSSGIGPQASQRANPRGGPRQRRRVLG